MFMISFIVSLCNQELFLDIFITWTFIHDKIILNVAIVYKLSIQIFSFVHHRNLILFC